MASQSTIVRAGESADRPTSVHCIFWSSDVLAHIAEISEDETTVRALALTSLFINRAVQTILYSHISLDEQEAHEAGVWTKRFLLSEAIQTRPELALAIRAITISLPGSADVTDLIRSCRHLKSLVLKVLPGKLSPTVAVRQRMPHTLPAIPDCVRYLKIHQAVHTIFWPDNVEVALQGACHLRHLSVYAPFTFAAAVLKVLGPQLYRLSLTIYHSSSEPSVATSLTGTRIIEGLGDLLPLIPSVTHLRLANTLDSNLCHISFPPALEKLTIRSEDFRDISTLVQLLSDVKWCQKLQQFPHVEEIVSTGMTPSTRAGMAKFAKFQAACIIAMETVRSRDNWPWKDGVASIQAIQNRVTVLYDDKARRLRLARDKRILEDLRPRLVSLSGSNGGAGNTREGEASPSTTPTTKPGGGYHWPLTRRLMCELEAAEI